jgi:TfoX/Sxy family transcriptional regulator of competence genes
MSVSPNFLDFVLDQLGKLGAVRARRMNYFRVPSDVLEDADEIVTWAHKSLRAASAAAASNSSRKRKLCTAARVRTGAKNRNLANS